VQWLGFEWALVKVLCLNYFDQLHDWAIELVVRHTAYVMTCRQTGP
jgi:glutamyl/glutaminyl-tRNA synthetase